MGAFSESFRGRSGCRSTFRPLDAVVHRDRGGQPVHPAPNLEDPDVVFGAVRCSQAQDGDTAPSPGCGHDPARSRFRHLVEDALALYCSVTDNQALARHLISNLLIQPEGQNIA